MLRWLEFLVLYIGVPFVLAMFLPPRALYPVLGAGGVVGIILLHFTPGFRWKSLLGPIHWKPALGLGVVTFVLASLMCWIILPDRFWSLILNAPMMMIMLGLLYPPILVVPQEIVYRALFFERYGSLFPNQQVAIFVNAVVFAFGHLMYWHWVVLLATFIGSYFFALAYVKPKGFMQAVVLHSVAGCAIFASGLGWLFFSGGAVSQ